jgi:hypothetical protein
MQVPDGQWFKAKMFVISVTRFLMDPSIHVTKHVTVLPCWIAAA